MNMVEKLREFLEKTPREEVKRIWDSYEDDPNGIKVEDYIEEMREVREVCVMAYDGGKLRGHELHSAMGNIQGQLGSSNTKHWVLMYDKNEYCPDKIHQIIQQYKDKYGDITKAVFSELSLKVREEARIEGD